jgi:DNA polymerase
MSIVRVHHDKETFSECDLKQAGAYKYAQTPSTDCLLTSGLVEGERTIRRWRPGDRYPYADIHRDDIEIHAWNSQFERLIWQHVMVPRYGWPKLALEQFVCVSAQARITAAGPAKLDIAGKFFNRRHKKDNKGHLHMLKMCRPATEAQQREFMNRAGAKLDFMGRNVTHQELLELAKRCHHTPDAIDRLHDYCDQDVFTEVDISEMLPPWSPEDLADFHLNERINDQGVVIDRAFAQAATRYAEDEKLFFASEIRRLSGGAVETPRQFKRIQDWLLPLLSDEAQDVCKWYDNGVPKHSFDADTRANLLSEAAADLDWIAYDPRDADMIVEFIEMMDAAGKSSIAKYQALCDRAIEDRDGNFRIHGLYVFAGASQSGRFSSSGIQAHNLVRDVPKNAKPMIAAFKRDDGKAVRNEVTAWAEKHNANATRKVMAEPVHALGRLIRPAFTGCPQGEFDLVWGDWSAIEACALPWLSLHPDAEDRLAMLRKGEDIYLRTASRILGHKVTAEDKDERQAYGKVPELSMGYLGGAGAYKAMAKNYGVQLPEKKILGIVKSWREDNPWANDFGEGCVKAAMAALRRKDGASFSSGRLEYWYNPDALDGIGCLFCKLPSGREIPYPGARIQLVVPKWGGEHLGITAMKSAWHLKKGEPWESWPRVSLWKGLLIENATQGICADLMRLGLDRCDRAGLTVCMHTHDEIVLETPAPDEDAARLHRIMTKAPPWPGAQMLPLRAEVDTGFRYKIKFQEAA